MHILNLHLKDAAKESQTNTNLQTFNLSGLLLTM